MFGIVRAIFRRIGMMLGLAQGTIDEQNAEIMKNPTLMRQGGQKAKVQLKREYDQLSDLVASKLRDRMTKERRIKSNIARRALITQAKTFKITQPGGKDSIEKMGYELSVAARNDEGATQALLTRIKELGATDANDPTAANDPQFQEIVRDLNGFISLQEELQGRLDTLDTELDGIIKNDTAAVGVLNTQLRNDQATLHEKERELADIDGMVDGVISDVLEAKREKERKDRELSIEDGKATDMLRDLKKMGEKARSESAVAREMTSGAEVNSKYLNSNRASTAVNDRLNALLNPNPAKPSEEKSKTREVDSLPNG